MGRWANGLSGLRARADAPESHQLTRRVFLALLGLVYCAAFVSLWVQIHGLVGSGGIQPAERLLEQLTAQLAAERFWRLPTLFWLWPSDAGLHAVCALGSLAALALGVGAAPRLAAAVAWAAYLSLVSVGGIFLGYQWDALLLETGFLAIWLGAPRWRPRAAAAAPVEPIAVWLLRFLLFKLMFLSGAVKLLSGDETWRSFTAMNFHYWTQPLPSPTSWWMHQLPEALHAVEVGGTFFVELFVTFLIFAPRPWRWLAFPILAGLQLLIFATGNYGFFNLLTLTLAVLVLDDAALSRTERPQAPSSGVRTWPPRRVAFASFAALLFALSLLRATDRLQVSLVRPPPLVAIAGATAQFHSINAYGLFAVMTTQRDEVALEGSLDGREWHAYRFRYKPDRSRPPRFAGLHMPRLDWQLWFAALRGCRNVPWFHAFLERVLEAEPTVLALLEHDPFGGIPPHSLRTPLARYTFGAWQTDDWWQAEPRGSFCPGVELRGGRLMPAESGPRVRSQRFPSRASPR